MLKNQQRSAHTATAASLAFFLFAIICGCSTIQKARDAQECKTPLGGERTLLASNVFLHNGSTVSVERLGEIALEHHPSILQASQAVVVARSQIKIIKAGRLPHIGVDGGYTRSTSNSGGNNRSEMSGSWSGSLGLNLMIYDFGKLDAADRQMAEELIAAEQSFRETQVSLIYAVRAAFFEVHRAEHLLTVAEDNLHQYKIHLEEAKAMLDVGSCRKYDVTKAEVDYGNAQLDLITISNNLVTARAELNKTIGIADSPDFFLKTSELPKRQINAGIDELMAIARFNSPNLAVLLARERAANAYVDETIADMYPSVSAGLNMSTSGKSSFPFSFNWSWFTKATWDLFTGFRRVETVNTAVAALRSSRARYAAAEQQLYRDIVDAVAQRDSARESSKISRKTLLQAKENLEIVNEQFRVGTSSSIERTDAQVLVTQARADMVRAYYDEQIAQAKIASLVGLINGPMPKVDAEEK